MPAWIRLALIGAAAVVAFDAAASVASRVTGVAYSWATVGSWLLYAGFGYLASRAAGGSVQVAALTGAVLGATDASLGWAVSWALGPGRMPGVDARRWVSTLIFVAALAAGIAAIGGAMARRDQGSDQPAV